MRFLLALFYLIVPVAAHADVVAAELMSPTLRYAHGVLGDAEEWGALRITSRKCASCKVEAATMNLPDSRVFEDIAARVVDVNADGENEVLVVESDENYGASLALYNENGKITATDFIGQRNRWLAPSGIADFDQDGKPEIAYVDRPHLLGDLVFTRFENGKLNEIARVKGLTNHRIGDNFISGGVYTCGDFPELRLANLSWSRVMRVSWQSGAPIVEDVGPLPEAGLNQALSCTP